jgi:hypothetical protein
VLFSGQWQTTAQPVRHEAPKVEKRRDPLERNRPKLAHAGNLSGVNSKICMPRTTLTLPQILAWADEHVQRTGNHPNAYAGAISAIDAPLGLNWRKVDNALRKGFRGLPSGLSLAALLETHRGVRNKGRPPRLTDDVILDWVDAYRAATGNWPTEYSGPVQNAPGETWSRLNAALAMGLRGLKGRRSLAKLIAKRRHVRNRATVPRLTIAKILRMADFHRNRTGLWPKLADGPIPGYPGETWMAINCALHYGGRSLPGGSSLAEVLRMHRGRRNKSKLPRLTAAAIIEWAKAHEARTGRLPSANSGWITPYGENWRALDFALRQGFRGLPGGSSLAKLLNKPRARR